MNKPQITANKTPRTEKEVEMYRAGWKDAIAYNAFNKSFKQRLHRLLTRLRIKPRNTWTQVDEVGLVVPKGKWKLQSHVSTSPGEPIFITIKRKKL